MTVKGKPYEQFGDFVLLKKLETDAFSELWRATRLDPNSPAPLVALRRFTGRAASPVTAATAHAAAIVPNLVGTSFVRNQTIAVAGSTPYVVHEYSGGRSLRHIVDRARGNNGVTANPIPIEQAIAIAERIALSLATTAELRFGATRLSHGSLIPQFVWITDDGEIRVAGQQLGAGFLGALEDDAIATQIGAYFAPECRSSRDASKSSDVYSLGALLFLLVTGSEPPDALNASAVAQAVRAAKTMTGAAMPQDVRAVLEKCLAADPSMRFASIGEAKQALSALAHSGKYTASTFNLAFYISTLLKKELEAEALERERESKLDLAAFRERVAAPPAPEHADVRSPLTVPEARGSRKSIWAVAAVVVVAMIAGGAYVMSTRQRGIAAAPAAKPVTASVIAAPAPKPAIVSPPLIAVTATTPTTATAEPATTTAVDEATRKQAFEQAVQQKLQEEMMKLQADYNRQLKQQQARQTPAPAIVPQAAPPPPQQTATVARDDAPTAAELDRQRVINARVETPAPPVAPAPAPVETATTAPAPVVAAVREGDLVDVEHLDTAPHVVRAVPPMYPPMAARQRIETTVLLTVLISENGQVLDVRVLRGDKRFGFEDAAIKAVRGTRFSPAMKDGKRVKTWFPVPVAFKA